MWDDQMFNKLPDSLAVMKDDLIVAVVVYLSPPCITSPDNRIGSWAVPSNLAFRLDFFSVKLKSPVHLRYC